MEGNKIKVVGEKYPSLSHAFLSLAEEGFPLNLGYESNGISYGDYQGRRLSYYYLASSSTFAT